MRKHGVKSEISLDAGNL